VKLKEKTPTKPKVDDDDVYFYSEDEEEKGTNEEV